eukprot:GHVN01083462.1.p1 GENE.GHVN01083462.1~~GHVN01083462.1.p1  ORF type:complete len:104 (+),score=7.28 GHVN01083462.1:788-1099(+)
MALLFYQRQLDWRKSEESVLSYWRNTLEAQPGREKGDGHKPDTWGGDSRTKTVWGTTNIGQQLRQRPRFTNTTFEQGVWLARVIEADVAVEPPQNNTDVKAAV